MIAARSDALVSFGATGDLAYREIFPARQAMLKRGKLEVPGIGVAHRRPGAGTDTRRFECESHTRGPEELARVAPPGGRRNPLLSS